MSRQATDADANAARESSLRGLAAILSFGFALAVVVVVDVAMVVSIVESAPPSRKTLPAVYLPELSPYAIRDDIDKSLYIADTFLFPIVLLATLSVLNCWLATGRFAGSWLERCATRAAPWSLLCAVAMVIALGVADFRQVDYLQHNWFALHPIWSVPVACVFFSLTVGVQKTSGLGPLIKKAVDVLAVGVLGVMFLFSLVDETYMVRAPLSQSFNAVYHTAAQVYLGKAILVNHLHQYGLYPHFLQPLFAVIGLSVFKYSLVMQGLTLLEYGLIYLFLRRVLANRMIAWLGLVAPAALILCGWIYSGDPRNDGSSVGHVYYQYLPIRTLFPVVFLYLGRRYIETRSPRLYYVSFVLYAAGCLWNMDTGVVVYFAWLLTLGYLELAGPTRPSASVVAGRILRHVVTAFVVLAGVTTCYATAIRIGYGAWPDFNALAQYQDLFYRHGFFMLPMPLVHPWNLLILVYMVALTIALSRLVSGRGSAESATLFMISVLGVGVFSYYQGRSHNDVFLPTCYPAVFLMCIFTDWYAASLTRDESQAPRKVVAVLMLYVLFSGVPTLCSTLGSVFTHLGRQLNDVAGGRIWRADQAFLRHAVAPGDDVLVLGFQRTGIYHQAIGKPCPLDVPSMLELVLVQDLDKIDEFIKSDGQKKIILSQQDVLSPVLTELARRLYAERYVIAINDRIACFGGRIKQADRRRASEASQAPVDADKSPDAR